MSIKISNSRIHGKGIFAGRDFKEGEVVLHWDSYARPISGQERSRLSEVEKKMVFDGKLYASVSQFINHSCNANVSNVNGYDTAIRDIKRGEEITCDYHKEDVPFINLNCNCGSNNCRKVLEHQMFKVKDGIN
jgi:uncharacterized protein